MASSRKPLDGKATGLMVLLGLIWSFQQIVLKWSATDMAPILQISLRSGFAAILVAGLLHYKGESICPDLRAWKGGLLAGVLYALEYIFIGEGLRHTSASHMIIFIYTAPAFAALGLHLLMPEERLSLVQWGGMAVAFCGIVITFWGRSPDNPDAGSMLIGDLMGLLGGFFWGATTVVIRCSRLAEISSVHTLMYQLVLCFPLMLLAAFFMDQTAFVLSPAVWGSMVYQVFIMSFASLLIWFWLLRTYMASRLGVLSFLTPIFGVLLGIVFLEESLEPRFLAGALLVLFGIILVSGHGWLKSVPRPGNRARGKKA